MIFFKSLSKINAFSFDLDDTFYDNLPYILEAEKYLLTYIAKHYPQATCMSPHDWQQCKLDALKESPSIAHDMGTLRTVTLTKGFLKAGISSEDIPNAVTACFDAFYAKRSDFQVAKEYREVLAKLAKKRPLVAITNGNVNCKTIGIEDYFSHILHAGPDGRMKPFADMFEKASVLLNIPENEILHVGDNLQKDVAGAIEAGFQAAWYADNRTMFLPSEKVTLLPHVQLESLAELMQLQ